MLFYWWGKVCICCSRFGCVVLGSQELMTRMENSQEGLTSSRDKSKQYSARTRLRRSMVGDNLVYSLFVSGSSTGFPWAFYCTICHSDVFMRTRGAGEFGRHFGTPKQWEADVTYRVHNGLPVYGRDPLTLSAEQRAIYSSRPCRGRAGFPFPENFLPPCTGEGSDVPLMAMMNCLLELLRWGGSYVFLRRLWGCFRATLKSEDPLYNVMWSRCESLVR